MFEGLTSNPLHYPQIADFIDFFFFCHQVISGAQCLHNGVPSDYFLSSRRDEREKGDTTASLHLPVRLPACKCFMWWPVDLSQGPWTWSCVHSATQGWLPVADRHYNPALGLVSEDKVQTLT